LTEVLANRLRQTLDTEARAQGFAAWGVAEAGPSVSFQHFKDWLGRGFHGDMSYLERDLDVRADPRRLMPGIKSVVVFADSTRDDLPEAHDGSVVARYACGQDYHRVMKDRMKLVVAALKKIYPALKARVLADSAPVLEHEWAARSGVGWIGKNTLTLNSQLGSHLTLGTVWLNTALAPDAPAVGQCGICRACLDACPTGAILEEGRVDGRRCISYLTIEMKGPHGPEEQQLLGGHAFGCDICQDVCPWNHRMGHVYPQRQEIYGSLFRSMSAGAIRQALTEASASLDQFGKTYGHTPLSRTGPEGLRRNLGDGAQVTPGN
jgi:epoxyqueuosine reductase